VHLKENTTTKKQNQQFFPCDMVKFRKFYYTGINKYFTSWWTTFFRGNYVIIFSAAGKDKIAKIDKNGDTNPTFVHGFIVL